MLKNIHRHLKHSVKVLHFEVRRQLELVADVVAALPRVGHVDCEDQRLVAERLHAVHHMFRQLPVSVHIQLEPAVAVGCCCHDLLHRARGICAGDVAGVEGLGGCGTKAVTMISQRGKLHVHSYDKITPTFGVYSKFFHLHNKCYKNTSQGLKLSNIRLAGSLTVWLLMQL